MAYVNKNTTKKLIIVPSNPYMFIYLKFLKNLLFFKLKPPENIIGGKIKKNIICPSKTNCCLCTILYYFILIKNKYIYN
jgi:hypothetical protein